jgi:hypothetical protein
LISGFSLFGLTRQLADPKFRTCTFGEDLT